MTDTDISPIAAEPVAAEAAHSRSTAKMTVLTAVSRGTGFVRILVVTGVLGTTYLANTYETANTVPNILFELFAAGALQAVMIPAIVSLVDRGDDEDTTHVVGSVLGLATVLIGALGAAAMVAAPWIMRIMVSDVPHAAVREAEVQLGTFFLFFFIPQVLLYVGNVVATAVLNATGSFALPVFAPTVNNVVVIATYLIFAAMRKGQPPTLDLALSEKLVLAIGTTLGVVAFCAIPIVAASRRVRLRMRFDRRHPAVRRLAREGSWAAVFLALSQVLLVVMLQISNRREGGVAVYQLAWVVFLLPHSLFSVPVMTTRFPSMTRQVTAGEWSGYADTLGRAVRSLTFLTLPATTLLIALARPVSRIIVHGHAVHRIGEIAEAIAGFAPGIVGYGLLLLFTRGCYSQRDARTPTLVNLAVTVVGVALMFPLADAVTGRHLVAVLGISYGIANTVGALALWWVLHRSVVHHRGEAHGTWGAVSRNLVGAAVAGAVVGLVAHAVGPVDVLASIGLVVAGSAVGVVLFLLLQTALGGPGPVAAVRSLGSASRSGHDGVATLGEAGPR
jgi:putative peptidoglycan lipid II flippase